MTHKEIIDSLNWRYATKTYDASKKLSDETVNAILESGRLAPSAIGLEPWKFILVNNPDVRQKLRTAGYDQSKITDASHLIVIARRTDSENLSPELVARTAKAQGKSEGDLAGLKQMADGGVAAQVSAGRIDGWLAGQTYIPLGMMIETASLLGVDTGPMEGFDAAQVDEILGLNAKNLSVVSMLALGYRGEDAYATLPKVRRAFDEVIEVVN